MVRTRIGLALLALVGLAITVVSAQAATMEYGDFMGDDVVFLDVTEMNGGDELLFEEPSVGGNQLIFSPSNFLSEVDPGGPPNATSIVDSTITTTIMAMAGSVIDTLTMTEAGDFTLIGLPDVMAQATVGVAFFWAVTEINGVPVADGPSGAANMMFTTGGGPNGGEYVLPDDMGTATIWQGEARIEVGSMMPAGQNATKVRLTFDNTLTTLADTGASAFIKKKQTSGIRIMINIPEPSSLAIVGIVALCFGATARRRAR